MNVHRLSRISSVISFLLAVVWMFSMPAAVRAATALDMYVIPPCRLYDSRLANSSNPQGPLVPTVIYSINLNSGGCVLPPDAQTLVVNLTAVSATPPTGTAPRTGYISLFAGGAPPPGFGVAFREGDYRALFLMTRVGQAPNPALSVQGVMALPSYHVVIDVMGYMGSGASSAIDLDNNSVLENQPAGTPVGNLSTIDPDIGENHHYSLVAGEGDTDNVKFQISGKRLLTGAVLDRETQATYSVRLRSTDSLGVFLEEVFTITALNENEAPTGLSLGSTSVDEEMPAGTPVGTFSATDPDLPDSHTYSLVSDPLGPDNGSFQISGDQLRTNAVLDRETQASFIIYVQAADQGGLTFRRQVTVTVDDVNDAPVVSGGPFALVENSSLGAVAGTAAFTDQDAGQSHTFEIVSGNTGGAFAINPATGAITVAAPAAVDFETNPAFNLMVQVTDNGTPSRSGTASVVVNLVNANDAPVVSGGPFNLPENSADSTVVGSAVYMDQDAGQTHAFAITAGNTGSAFAINGSTGAIRVLNSAIVNFETNPVFNLLVRVTDNGSPGMSGTATVTITLANLAEMPVANDEGSSANPYVETVGNTLLEVTTAPSMPNPKIVYDGSFLANDSDPDGQTTFMVTLESSTPGAVVTLNSNGTFTYLPPTGFTGVDFFTYRITDSDALSDTARIYINVEGRVWYVRNDAAAGGLGRSVDPFDTLAEADLASSVGETIYVFEGDGTTAGQSDGIALDSGQRLIGEAVALVVPSVNINGVVGPTLHAAGGRPKIENDNTPDAAGEDNGVNVPAILGNAPSIEIRGLDIAGFDNAIDVTATGSKTAGVTIRDNVISGAGLEGIDVNDSSTGLVTVAIQDSTLTAAGDGISLTSTGTADVHLTVTGGVLQNIGGSALLADGDGSSRRTVTVSGVTFRDNNRGVRLLGSGNADLTFDVTGSTFLRHALDAIQVATASSSTVAMQVVGRIAGNVIGDGTAGSGSASSHGIAVDLAGDADSIVAITGNSAGGTAADGIYAQTRLDGGDGRLDLTLRDNTVQAPAGSSYGTRVEARNTSTVCLDIAGNTSAGAGGLEPFQTRQLDASTFLLERLSDGDGNPGEVITDMPAVETFLAGQNGAGSTADATRETAATGYTEAADGACRKPAV